MAESSDSYRLDLDPEQLRLYGGHINTRLLTLRRATESEASSLSPSTPDSIILYKSYVESGLKLPLTPLVRGILAYFDIAPCQVNPNFYRAISVASAAIPHLSPDLVLTPDLFANCYKLGFCRRSGNGTPLGLFVISRHLDVAVPGWSLPRSEERWMHDPFVATGKSWQGQSRGPQIRCAPNRCVDFVRPPPLLSGKYATAFELMRRGRNLAFEKFLKRSVAQEDSVVASPSPPETVGKRRKLSRVPSDKELPSHVPATPTIEKPKIRRGILQRKRKAQEDETKARYQPTLARNIKPSDAPSAPQIPSSITVLKIDSGLTRRQIGQRRRYARKKQSNTIKESKAKGKPTIVASLSSTKLPPTSTLETTFKGKGMIVASQLSMIPAPLTSNTEPHKPTGATIPIERYEAVLPSVPNCPDSPNSQTDLLTPVSIITQNFTNDQTTIPPLEVPSHVPATAALETTRTRPSSKRIIAQREKKAKENENKAKSQATHATIVVPSDAASGPHVPPSTTTDLAADSGVLRRQIGQRRRRAREKQSNTNIESEPVVASPASLKLPPTSTTETACNGKDKFVASPSSLILPPLTSNTQPYGPAGAEMPIQRYEVPLPFIPNCPVSPNSQTDVPTPVGSANRSEDEPTQGLHFEPSPTCPPKCPSQLLNSQPGVQAATNTILAIPFVRQESPVIEANSIIECPAAATKDVGKFCLPQNVELEEVDVDGASTDAIFMRAMTLFELGAKRLCETHKSGCSSDGLREENERLNAEVERLKQQCSEVRRLKDQLNAEKGMVERQLGATMSKYSSQAVAIASLHAEKDELYRSLDQARTEITVRNLDVRDLQRFKLENQVLKTDVEGLRKQCSELKTQIGIDACDVQRPENQLNAERVKRELGETRNLVFSQTATIADLRAEKDELSRLLEQSREEMAAQSSVVRELQGLKEENKDLKAEVEGLTMECSELKAQKDSAFSEFERELGETRTKVSSQATAITKLCADKGELTRLLEQSRDEIAAKNSVVGELQANITKLEGKVASSMQRESIIKTLRDSALLADQLADADVKRSRQAGYNDGLIDGRRIGWKEFAELQKGEPFQPESSIHSSAATQAGSSSVPPQ